MVRTAVGVLLLAAGCAERTTDPAQSPPVTITLGPGDQLRIGDRPTEVGRLAADLKRLGVDPRRDRIYISGDDEIAYRNFMPVMNALQDAGFYSVALVGTDMAPATAPRHEGPPRAAP